MSGCGGGAELPTADWVTTCWNSHMKTAPSTLFKLLLFGLC